MMTPRKKGSEKFQRRWHKQKRRPVKRKKTYISAGSLRKAIVSQLDGYLDDDLLQIHIADEEYYCTPMADAVEIIGASSLDRQTWVAERFDCDDFAKVLAANFAQASYLNGKRRAAHCFGIVWGVFDGEAHAVNWFIADDGKLYFVEPQTDEIFLPRDGIEDIFMMMV